MVWVGNGVSRQLLLGLPGTPPDAALVHLPGPRFGYVGMIAHYVTVEPHVDLR